MAAKVKGRFIDPMLLRTDILPNDGSRWEYQLKFAGYRAIAFKTGGKIHLRSRNDNDFSIRYSGVLKGLANLPDETVIDGEVIALDDDGRPSFNILQNYGSEYRCTTVCIEPFERMTASLTAPECRRRAAVWLYDFGGCGCCPSMVGPS